MINVQTKHHNATHGESNASKEYGTWARILRRCYNPNDNRYYSHGARGIKVCRRWHDYENFLADMGRAPSKDHSIERINNNKDYQPSNCKWATPSEQANNKRRTVFVDFKGERIALGMLCSRFGLPIELIRGRINIGWSVDRAIETPCESKNKRWLSKL